MKNGQLLVEAYQLACLRFDQLLQLFDDRRLIFFSLVLY